MPSLLEVILTEITYYLNGGSIHFLGAAEWASAVSTVGKDVVKFLLRGFKFASFQGIMWEQLLLHMLQVSIEGFVSHRFLGLKKGSPQRLNAQGGKT